MKKKEQNLLKKLEKLEPPKAVEPPKEEIKVQTKKDPKAAVKGKGAKEEKKTKKQLQQEEEERKRKEAEEAERKRKEEEERKKKEEEEAARKAEEEKKAKGGAKSGAAAAKGGKKQEEEKKEEPVVETEEQRIAREKAEVNNQIDELKKQIEAYNNKLKLLLENQTKMLDEEQKPKVVDLIEKTGERKHLKASADQYATGLLRERKAYVLVKITKGANDEEVVENVVIDGGCIRTPEEDIKWEEEQKELEAQANKKGGKGGPAPKKK